MALSLILGWLGTHVGTWLTPVLTLVLGAVGARFVTQNKAQAKIDAAQVKVDHAQAQATQATQQAASAKADAQEAQAETKAVRQADAAEKNAAAIPDDKLDDEGKSRGLLRD